MAIIGIDLGTTNSLACVCQGGVSTLVIEEKFYKPQKCGIFCQILLDYLLYMLYN